MKENQKFILVFHEGENGPYELEGNAFSIYRAVILIGHGREHIRCEVLDELRNVVPTEEFLDACIQDVQSWTK